MSNYVYVYRNLKHGRSAPPLYSIMRDGKVIDRRHRVFLSDASFVVREAGRQKVLTQRRKNVHAFVKGRLIGDEVTPPATLPVKVSYNPYAGPDFTADGRAVKHAQAVLLDASGITAAYLD